MTSRGVIGQPSDLLSVGTVRSAERAEAGVRWPAAIRAGALAGAVFLVALLVLPLVDGSGWAPVRMVAAMLLGPEVLQPATFALVPSLVALVIHGSLSILYAAAITLVVRRMRWGGALASGTGLGLALYLVNLYGFTLVYPWFAAARGPFALGVHLLFGLVAASGYKHFARAREELPHRAERRARRGQVVARV